MKKGAFIIVGVIALAFVLIFLGRSGSNSTANYEQSNQQADINGYAAPDFTLALLDGGTVKLSDYHGVKPVVLDFWASWCPNCKRDLPHLNSFYEKYKDQVEVIGINLHENTNTVKKFVTSTNLTFPIALDPNSVAARAFGIQYTNSHILIDKDGKIVKIIPGDIRESDFQSLIQL